MSKMPSYQKYVDAYMAKSNQLAKQGYSMYDQMYSAEEYVTNYLGLRADQAVDVALGKRKRTGNILRDLVNDQAYQFTKRQALKQLEAAKQLGHRTTIQQLMAGDKVLGDILKAQRDILKQQGYSNKEVNLIISQEYFGSE